MESQKFYSKNVFLKTNTINDKRLNTFRIYMFQDIFFQEKKEADLGFRVS